MPRRVKDVKYVQQRRKTKRKKEFKISKTTIVHAMKMFIVTNQSISCIRLNNKAINALYESAHHIAPSIFTFHFTLVWRFIILYNHLKYYKQDELDASIMPCQNDAGFAPNRVRSLLFLSSPPPITNVVTLFSRLKNEKYSR